MTRFSISGREPPVLLVKWYDFTRWLLERIDSFPKNQRFVFGTRRADHAPDVLESLVEASYSPRKADLLARANRKIEMLRWLIRLAKDRQVLTEKPYLFACKCLAECGRMLGGYREKMARDHHAIQARVAACYDCVTAGLDRSQNQPRWETSVSATESAR